jgi:subtilisin family serine protease
VIRAGHLSLTLRVGFERPHVPAHLDCLTGAGRPAAALDIPALDRAVDRWGGGGRWRLVFHARAALGRHGAQHVGFAEDEHALGLSRSYQLQLADPAHARDVVAALRDLDCVEGCGEQALAIAPMDATAPPSAVAASRRVTAEQAAEPYRRVRALEALREEPGLRTLSVAVVDTGVVVGHPELQQRCLAGYDAVDLGLGRLNERMELVGDSRGRDYNPYDEVGHGCLVAGIIGAGGWRLPPGLAGLALLLPVRALAAARMAGSGGKVLGVGALPNIDEGIKIAIDLGARVVNLSLGSAARALDPEAPPPHRAVARYAEARGAILVAAAGNSGREEKFFPAALEGVIAVASAGADGTRSRFSTHGDHVALAAPGERIVGVARRGYQASSGTSFAAPFVAGAVALMAARAERRGRRLTARAAKRLLRETAQPLPPGQKIGAGLLDALAAVRAVDRWCATEGEAAR